MLNINVMWALQILLIVIVKIKNDMIDTYASTYIKQLERLQEHETYLRNPDYHESQLRDVRFPFLPRQTEGTGEYIYTAARFVPWKLFVVSSHKLYHICPHSHLFLCWTVFCPKRWKFLIVLHQHWNEKKLFFDAIGYYFDYLLFLIYSVCYNEKLI